MGGRPVATDAGSAARARGPALGLLLYAIVAPCASTVLAADIEVTAAAARTGSYGLAVTLGSACSHDPDPVFEEYVVVGEERFEGCSSLTVGNGFVISGTGRAILASGGTVAVGNGFAVEAEGELVAGNEISYSTFAWVERGLGTPRKRYVAEFHTNFDALVLDGELEHLVAYSGDGSAQLKVVLRPGPAVVVAVRQDDGSYVETRAVPTAAGWNAISVTWEATASSTVSVNVNTVPRTSVTDVANPTARVDHVRWGAVAGGPASLGVIFQDDFRGWCCDP